MSTTPPSSLRDKPCRWNVHFSKLIGLNIAEVVARDAREAEDTALDSPAAHLDNKTPREVGAVVDKVELIYTLEVPSVLKWRGGELGLKKYR